MGLRDDCDCAVKRISMFTVRMLKLLQGAVGLGIGMVVFKK